MTEGEPSPTAGHAWQGDGPTAEAGRVDEVVLAKIAEFIRGRAELRRLVSGMLIADPCFDLLLDAYRHELSGRDYDLTAACRATGVPAATAWRWIKAAAAADLVVLVDQDAQSDERGIGLSPSGRMTMLNWTAAMGWRSPPAGTAPD